MDIAEMINEVKGAADDYLEFMNDTFADDPHMLQVGKDDFQDIMYGADLMYNGHFALAGKHFAYLDTLVRDLIPEDAYEFCMNEYEKENY